MPGFLEFILSTNSPSFGFIKWVELIQVETFKVNFKNVSDVQVVTILHKILDDADVTYEGYEAFNVAGRSWHKSHGYS